MDDGLGQATQPFKGVYSDTTQLNSTQLDVELSWIELCRYKHPLKASY